MGEIGMTDSSAEDDIKTSVLVDNTAQGIFNYLEHIENRRETYAQRWAWELIQNAIDSSEETGGLDIYLSLNENTLIFKHNGRPFSKEEVAHLIYHGSTKKEHDLGKFGTGFLVTHLLSRAVKVTGTREDRNQFSFLLDRNGNTPDEIKEHSEESWKTYKKSIKPIKSATGSTAVFEYAVIEANLETARNGMDHLKKYSPFILVFNEKIQSLTVEVDGSKTVFRSELSLSRDNFRHFDVKVESGGDPPQEEKIIVGQEENVSVAINFQRQSDGKFTIRDHRKTSKLFIGLPLVGTEEFPIPFPVNSHDFVPYENRDRVYLGQDDTDIVKKNKGIIELSLRLVLKTLSELYPGEVDGFEKVLEFPELSDKFEVDAEWLESAQRDFIEGVQSFKVIRTAQNGFLQFGDSVVLLDDSLSESDQVIVWKLAHELEPYSLKLPALDISIRWKAIILSWERIGITINEQIKLTLKKLAVFISGTGSLIELTKNILNGKKPLSWLNQFYEVIKEGNENLFDQEILPSQVGTLIKRNSAYVDVDIEESIKDVCDALGINLRNELLDKEVSKSVLKLVKTKRQSDVLDGVKAVVSSFKANEMDYKKGNRMFFVWILRNEKLALLDGFPIESESIGVPIKLSTEIEEKPLAPKELWNEYARNYLELFPAEHVISSSYFDPILDKEKWKLLESGGYLRLDPLYLDEIKIDDELLNKMSANLDDLSNQPEHEITVKVEVSKIALWNLKDDKGLMDTVRKSHAQARRFLNFLFEYISVADPKWKETAEIECQCKNMHEIYPSFWLAKLKEIKWVPTTKNHQDVPTTQNLAKVIESEPDLVSKCKDELPSSLLDHLGISVSSLIITMAAKDDATRLQMEGAAGSLFHAFSTDPTGLNKVAKLAEANPVLFVDEISKRFDEHALIVSNQTRGRLVESLLASALRENGLDLIRTGIGSDYCTDNDFVENNQEVTFQVQHKKKIILYIEVKSTKSESAKMTIVQARESVKRNDDFVLAVVPLKSDIVTEQSTKESVRFVFGIGQKIQDKLKRVESISVDQDSISKGNVGIKVEWKGNDVRFVVEERIWQEGIGFEKFIHKVTAKAT